MGCRGDGWALQWLADGRVNIQAGNGPALNLSYDAAVCRRYAGYTSDLYDALRDFRGLPDPPGVRYVILFPDGIVEAFFALNGPGAAAAVVFYGRCATAGYELVGHRAVRVAGAVCMVARGSSDHSLYFTLRGTGRQISAVCSTLAEVEGMSPACIAQLGWAGTNAVLVEAGADDAPERSAPL